jgi:hypothetical protein
MVAVLGLAWLLGAAELAGSQLLAISTWNKYKDILTEQPITNNNCEGESDYT